MTLLVLLMLAAVDDPVAKPPAARFSKEEIIAGIERRFSMMSSMRVTYTCKADPTLENLADDLTITSVRSGDNFLVDTRFAPEHGGRYVRSTDGKTSRNHNVAAGSTIITGPDERIYRYDTLSFLMSIPLSREDRDWVAPIGNVGDEDLFRSKGLLPATIVAPDYVIAPDQEKVDDAWCHVVTTTAPRTIHFKYWIDPACDFAVRRRETITGPNFVLDRLTFNDWKPQGKTWFPTGVTEENFSFVRNAVPFGTMKRSRLRTLNIQNVQIGGITEKDAMVQLVPGMLVQDSLNNKTSTIPGQPEERFLEELRAARLEMKDYMKPATLPGSTTPPSATSTPK